MYLVGFLLLATPVVFVALLALAIDVTARKSRERKAVDEVVQTRLTDGNLGDVGELSCEKQRQGSNVVRVCVVLGFVLTGVCCTCRRWPGSPAFLIRTVTRPQSP